MGIVAQVPGLSSFIGRRPAAPQRLAGEWGALIGGSTLPQIGSTAHLARMAGWAAFVYGLSFGETAGAYSVNTKVGQWSFLPGSIAPKGAGLDAITYSNGNSFVVTVEGSTSMLDHSLNGATELLFSTARNGDTHLFPPLVTPISRPLT